MYGLFFVTVLIQRVFAQDISAITDIKTLSELPLEKLLLLKNNFNMENMKSDEEISTKLDVEVTPNGPEALPLQSKPIVHNRGGHGHDDYGEKDKKDTSTIFQFSVTALSFVAFGGYLLCLIVQAIRAKNAATTTTTTMAPGGNFATLLRPGRPFGQQLPSRIPRPGFDRYKRQAQPSIDSDNMYEALLILAEGYSKYHTVDYKLFNQTRNIW
ncbi:hypothetical protein RI129_007515 [Pyrocoelia pectoralis]|uniref:Uncharacterized protein n=1 Tax=Pyrocoelia pectoralis TaxID=417401 RepID=A0AAN7ZEX7_9COLE